MEKIEDKEIFYDKKEVPCSDKCYFCGKPKKAYQYTHKITGKTHVLVEECKCEKEKRLEVERLKQQELQLAFSKKCKRLFPLEAFEPDIEKYTFGNFELVPEAKGAFEETKKACFSYWGKYGINLVGSYGSGKTRLGLTYLNERNQKGEDCIAVEYARIFDRIFATIDKENKETKKDLLDCLCNVKNLLIDELGVGTNTPAKEDLFLLILNERKRKNLVTLFTMNPEGEKNLGGRIRSRLNEFARPVPNNAPDYRPKALRKKIAEEKKMRKEFEKTHA